MIRIILGLSLLAAIGACSGGGQQELREFDAFYQRFMSDSLYQIEHIVFPLEGLPDNADSATINGNNFRWERNNWTMHRRFDPNDSGFTLEFVPFGDDLMIEKIVHRSGEYGMIRRFAKLNGEWNLIYYAGLNRLVPKPAAEEKSDKGIDIEGGFQE